MNNQLAKGIMIGIALTALTFFIYDYIRLKSDSQDRPSSVGQNTTTITAEAEKSDSGPVSVTSSIDDDPYLGDIEKAKVAIVEFSDYECPFCKKFHETTFDAIVSKYVESGQAIVVFRDFPLDFHNPAATLDARAANCVKELSDNKKYFEMMRSIYTNGNLNGQGISRDKLTQMAGQIGIDKDKFYQCLDSNKYTDEIQKDLEDGSSVGIDGTPGFVVGTLKANGQVEGELVSGAQPLSVFEEIINKQLAK